jgi:hypothetical protein
MMRCFLAFTFLALFSTLTYSQPSLGGQPESFNFNNLSANIDSRYIAKPDMAQIHYLDSMDSRWGYPYRIAVNIPVDLNMKNSGTWTDLPDHSGRIWRLNITSPDAHALGIYYSDFFLPSGAKFFLYNENRKQVLGTYTEFINPESGNFATELIQGGNVTLEYFEPYGISQPAIIDIEEIEYVYRGEGMINPDLENYKTSGACEVNVNCTPEGANWQDEKKGVCRLKIKMGAATYYCSGSLVRNTADNYTPYVLTADHCVFDSDAGSYATAADMNQWIFYFHYEAAVCTGTTSGAYKTKTGCALKAHDTYGSNHSGSDFCLLQLNSSVLAGDNLYFNGWSRSAVVSNSGVGIHHPDGDIMKISTYTSALTSVNFIGGTGTHWQVYWSGTTNGHGITEPGSSGSPLFNSTGLIIGTLTSGASCCTVDGCNQLGSGPDMPDFYGKFSNHWDGNGTSANKQLKPWLDPINSNPISINGSVTSIGESYSLNSSLSLFPNPVSREIHVAPGEISVKDPTIKIYSVLGELLCSRTWPGTINEDLIIDVHGQAPGMYFLSLETDHAIVTKKFVIQH